MFARLAQAALVIFVLFACLAGTVLVAGAVGLDDKFKAELEEANAKKISEQAELTEAERDLTEAKGDLLIDEAVAEAVRENVRDSQTIRRLLLLSVGQQVLLGIVLGWVTETFFIAVVIVVVRR